MTADERISSIIGVNSRSWAAFITLIAGLARQTVANVWRNKLRSFLTMFGIAWGVASLVLMSALCDGFRQGQRKNMSQIGDNLVFVFGGKTERHAAGQTAGRRIRLSERDVSAIREHCPAVEVVAADVKRYDTPAASRFNAGRFAVVGVTPEYLRLRNLPVEAGRQVNADDVSQRRRVCILGANVRKQLFEDRPGVLGQEVRIKGYPYRVIGLMSEKKQNSSYDGWDNDKILVPTPSLRRDCPPNRWAYDEGWINGLLYRPLSVQDWETAQRQVRRTLALLHNTDPEDKNAIIVRDTIEGALLFDSVFNATELFLAVIAVITLSLGGVGVMNTMMSAVVERTNEIGLKKALGATRRRILVDFFLEGLLLVALSGTLGMAAVGALASAVNALPLPPLFAGLPIEAGTAALALATLGTVAVLSAIPPAWRAARLTPVEALRFER